MYKAFAHEYLTKIGKEVKALCAGNKGFQSIAQIV